MEDLKHDVEGEKVEDGTDRSHSKHEIADHFHIPLPRADQILLVDLVQGDRDLGKVVDATEREVTENAAAGLVKQLLPLLDTADLALAHGGGEDMKQLAGALFDVLAKEGLERIVPEGQAFDPELHDGVAHEAAEGEGRAASPRGDAGVSSWLPMERPGAAPCDGQS